MADALQAAVEVAQAGRAGGRVGERGLDGGPQPRPGALQAAGDRRLRGGEEAGELGL